MVYLKDFEYLKPRTSKITYLQKFGNSTRKFPPPTPVPKDIHLSEILKSYIREYCDTSSVHGFRYLTHADYKVYEKFIWILILIATYIGCCFVYFDLAELYYTKRIQTTVADSVHPVFMIPFPSIAICLPYRINWQRLHNEAPKTFLPSNVSNETLHTFFEFFDKMAEIRFSTLKYLKPLFENSSRVDLKLIDDLDLLEVMEYLTFTCEEAFTGYCVWSTKVYNCCELLAVERTEMGYCYVFNSAVSPKFQEKQKNDRYYPYHNSKAGEGTGLEVRMRINEDLVSPNFTGFLGVYVMIKQPEQWNADVKFVNYNTFTKIAISSQVTETHPQARHVSPDDRRCIFEDETTHYLYKTLPGLRYWRGNCRTKCHQEYLLKYCKCNLNLLFPTTKMDNFTVCKPSNFKCLYDNSNIFSSEHHIFESQYIHDIGNDSMTCNCLNNCNQLLYDGIFNSVALEGTNASDTIKIVHLDVHFQSVYIVKYHTSMRYTFVELLASFGGIIGLFLGASLLSAVELVYYFTIGLYARLHTQLGEWYRTRSSSRPQRTRIKYRHVKISKAGDDVYYRY